MTYLTCPKQIWVLIFVGSHYVSFSCCVQWIGYNNKEAHTCSSRYYYFYLDKIVNCQSIFSWEESISTTENESTYSYCRTCSTFNNVSAVISCSVTKPGNKYPFWSKAAYISIIWVPARTSAVPFTSSMSTPLCITCYQTHPWVQWSTILPTSIMRPPLMLEE